MTEKELEELFNAYNMDVFRYAMSMLNQKEDAEDVVTSVFLKAFKYGIRNENKEAALISMTKQLCIDNIRHKIRRKAFEEAIDKEEPIVYTKETPEVELAWKCIRQMPTAQRNVMMLIYFYDYKPSEIAKELSLSPATVSAMHHRGINQIRKFIETGKRGVMSVDKSNQNRSNIIELIKNGLNYKEAMDKFNISSPTYYRYKKIALGE